MSRQQRSPSKFFITYSSGYKTKSLNNLCLFNQLVNLEEKFSEIEENSKQVDLIC